MKWDVSHFKCILSVDDQQITLGSDSTHSSAHIKTTITPHEYGERLLIMLYPQDEVIIDDVTS
jgi:hypothetical protein